MTGRGRVRSCTIWTEEPADLSLYLPSLLSPVTAKEAGLVIITAFVWLAVTASLIPTLHIHGPTGIVSHESVESPSVHSGTE
jgi:hypothetical protein